jgi:threonine synthase
VTVRSALICTGCGHVVPDDEDLPFRCPHAGEGDVDHVLRRHLSFPSESAPELGVLFDRDDHQPFRAYRELLHVYQLARSRGVSDAAYLDIVDRLDAAVAAVDGRGFTTTPFAASESLAREIGFADGGSIWVKDETNNVAGSHKARHLMGIGIWLEIVGLTTASRLAIASCGNAALAAAVVARAASRSLEVCIPAMINPSIVWRLTELGARLTECPRNPSIAGDPCVHRFHRSLDDGALPFTVQGNENALALDGGKTLAWEMVSALRTAGGTVDRLFVQVGGGGLASSCAQALEEAVSLGVLPRAPRLHAVQSAGASPVARAYDRVVERILEPMGDVPATRRERSGRVEAHLARGSLTAEDVEREVRFAAMHRSAFMWPWEEEPKSVADGILDDETYDWLAVVRGMILSGGYPVVVSEAVLIEAHELAHRCTDITVCPTGTAGLAGCLDRRRAGVIGADETAAVLFTGATR